MDEQQIRENERYTRLNCWRFARTHSQRAQTNSNGERRSTWEFLDSFLLAFQSFLYNYWFQRRKKIVLNIKLHAKSIKSARELIISSKKITKLSNCSRLLLHTQIGTIIYTVISIRFVSLAGWKQSDLLHASQPTMNISMWNNLASLRHFTSIYMLYPSGIWHSTLFFILFIHFHPHLSRDW